MLYFAVTNEKRRREDSNAIKRSCMHRLLDLEHAAPIWLIGRGTLDPKKMKVSDFPVISQSQHMPASLLDALLALLSITVLLIVPITLLALPVPHLPLTPRLITELVEANILRPRSKSPNLRHFR